MTLSISLQAELKKACIAYDFPKVTFDFDSRMNREHPTMLDVEKEISGQLRSHDIEIVKNGLSNVLYWGYARTGYRWTRINRFRSKVTDSKLQMARDLFAALTSTDLESIKALKLPEFSGMSFVSKVRMFLDPTRYVVLDQQLLKLRQQRTQTILHDKGINHLSTTIVITGSSEKVYAQWCSFCLRVAQSYFASDGFRAVDVERGIFHLVSTSNATLAAEILAVA